MYKIRTPNLFDLQFDCHSDPVFLPIMEYLIKYIIALLLILNKLLYHIVHFFYSQNLAVSSQGLNPEPHSQTPSGVLNKPLELYIRDHIVHC